MFLRFMATLSVLFFLSTNVWAGCCNYGCCDCSCVAVHVQRADIIERLLEIKSGYGYKEAGTTMSFKVVTDKAADTELKALNSEVKNLGVVCKLRKGETSDWLDCAL